MFTDAQEMAKNNPETFEAPSTDELEAVTAGQSVKVCASPERFWVTVTKVDGESVSGVVDNNLVCTGDHGLSLGDAVTFKKRHIYEVFQ